jgi:hypothetical protein
MSISSPRHSRANVSPLSHLPYLAIMAAAWCSTSVLAQTPTTGHFAGTGRITSGIFASLVLRSANNTAMQIGQLENDKFNLVSHPDPGSGHRIIAIVDLDANLRDDLVFQDTTQPEFGDVKVWRDFARTSQFTLSSVKKVWDVQAVGNLDGDFPSYGNLTWHYSVPDSPDTGVSYIWFTNGSSVTQIR